MIKNIKFEPPQILRFFESLRMKAAEAWDVLCDAVSNFSSNGDANQAAAISFYTILSAIPLFILTIIVAGNFFSAYPQIQADIIDTVRGFAPYFSERLMAQLGQIESKSGLLGWIGILILVWLSAFIFNAMETALDIIFHSRERRNFFISKLLAVCMIPLGWLIGAASLIISYVAALLTARAIVLPGDIVISLGEVTGFFLRYVIPYFVSVLFFYVLYWIIPTAKVRPAVLLAGSAFFALLMEISKQLFTFYIANYNRFGVIFGTLEPVVILIIWVFYVALLFLFCAELMSSYQRRDLILLERAMIKPHKSHMKVGARLFSKFGRTYPEGSLIFEEGNIGKEMFFVLSGRVSLEKHAGRAKKIISEAGPGQYFGETSALTDAPRATSARALENSHLAVIKGDTFGILMQESRDVGVLMLREFSSRLKNANASLEEISDSWLRLLVITYFLENQNVPMSYHIKKLAKLSKRTPGQIEESINHLAKKNILVIRNGKLKKVVKSKIWSVLDAKTLKAGISKS
ncbi:MAG TPA: YihY family inner membrane protein [Deltaproteobacteria bacterium]|nr:YihY family inner membrane protein [Deltaproteobacteria bacterium]